jgi:hypothetical protein
MDYINIITALIAAVFASLFTPFFKYRIDIWKEQ